MGKKATTISLEEHAWDLIQAYMDSKKLSNRNTAIEWIILEHKSYCDRCNKCDGNIMVSDPKAVTPVNDKPVKPKKEKRNSNVSDESFRANTFDMMPDE